MNTVDTPHRVHRIALLSTSDTDLLSARASLAAYRLGQPGAPTHRGRSRRRRSSGAAGARLLGGGRRGTRHAAGDRSAADRARRRTRAERRTDGVFDGPDRACRASTLVPRRRRAGQSRAAACFFVRHRAAHRSRIRRAGGDSRVGIRRAAQRRGHRQPRSDRRAVLPGPRGQRQLRFRACACRRDRCHRQRGRRPDLRVLAAQRARRTVRRAGRVWMPSWSACWRPAGRRRPRPVRAKTTRRGTSNASPQ